MFCRSGGGEGGVSRTVGSSVAWFDTKTVFAVSNGVTTRVWSSVAIWLGAVGCRHKCGIGCHRGRGPRSIGKGEENFMQLTGEGLSVRDPVFGLAPQEITDHATKQGRNFRGEREREFFLLKDQFPENGGFRGAGIGLFPRDHFIQEDAQRIEIGTTVKFGPARLLGRHVFRCANDLSGGGNGRLIQCCRDAEIGQFGLAALIDQHIGRFEIAMDDAMGMGVRQGGGQLVSDTEDISEWESGRLPDERAQVGRAEKLHDEKLRAIMFFNGVNRDDIVVLEPGHRAGLSEKPFREGGITAQMGMNLLDGDDAMEGTVQRFVNDAHPPPGDFLLNLVFSGKDIGCHRSNRYRWHDQGLGRIIPK